MDLNILRNSRLFYGMHDDWILKALKCLSAFESSYPKGSCFLDIGDTINKVGVLISGSANSVVETASGGRSIIEKLLPADVYGENIVFSGTQKSTMRIIAVEDCKVVKIHMENIIHKVNNCRFRSMIIENLLRLSASRCVALNRKMDILSHKTVRERVLLYLGEEMERCNGCEFCIHFSRRELAEYLQLDRSALSRELSRMKEEGIIDYNKSKFCILKFDKLEEIKMV